METSSGLLYLLRLRSSLASNRRSLPRMRSSREDHGTLASAIADAWCYCTGSGRPTAVALAFILSSRVVLHAWRLDGCISSAAGGRHLSMAKDTPASAPHLNCGQHLCWHDTTAHLHPLHCRLCHRQIVERCTDGRPQWLQLLGHVVWRLAIPVVWQSRLHHPQRHQSRMSALSSTLRCVMGTSTGLHDCGGGSNEHRGGVLSRCMMTRHCALSAERNCACRGIRVGEWTGHSCMMHRLKLAWYSDE